MKSGACYSVAANGSYESLVEDDRAVSSYDQARSQTMSTVVAAACGDCAYTYVHLCACIMLQVWTDPECSRRSRLPDFKTVGT